MAADCGSKKEHVTTAPNQLEQCDERIAVIDDNPNEARIYARSFRGVGRHVVPFSDLEGYESADALLDMLEAENFNRLVCDLVLNSSQSRRIPFNGAEIASKANRRAQPIPAMVFSSNVGTDDDIELRKLRADIPVVLEKRHVREQGRRALAVTVAEVCEGVIPRERRLAPSPIEVIRTVRYGETPTATVVVVGWHVTREIDIPLQPILDDLGLVGDADLPQWLEARVNCFARYEQDLFFREFTIAPNLPEGWMTG